MPDLDLQLVENRIDALIAPWTDKVGPGVTIGVVHEGQIIAHRSAGLANIEHRVPIGPATRFRIASVSKQFTTAAVLILAHEGKLGLEDTAATHLPALGLDGRVTLLHLMHNTSGIRDMLALMLLGGTHLGVPVTPQTLLDAISRQRGLNFEPGHRYLYSNSNFLLLGLIVERVSGQTLADFLETRIFAPLGMTRTMLTPDIHAAVPGLASGYRPLDGGWARAAHAFPLGGEGGLVSCVADLALWDHNLDTGRVGGDWLATQLAEQTPFANGTVNRYARGQAVRDYRGLRTISHGGLWPGYRTEFLRVPSRRTTVIAIANASNIDPNLLAHRTLDALLDGDRTVAAVPSWPDRAALRPLAGRYLDPSLPATLDIAVPDQGPPTLATFGLVSAAELLPDGRLAAARSSSVFAVRARGADTVEVEEDAETVSTWHRVAPGAAMPEGLLGQYANAETAATWSVQPDGAGGFAITATGPVSSGQPWPIEPIEGDVIRVHVPGTVWSMWYDAKLARDHTNEVTGLLVHAGRVKNMLFGRIHD